MFILGAVPLGYLADRTRRTYLVTVCSLLFAAFAFATGLVRNAWQLAVTRVLTGIGKSNTLPVHNSLLADAYPIPGRGRVFAIHNLANPVGLLIGPVLAGAIASAAGGDAGWRWAFMVLALPVVVLAFIALRLPEPQRGKHEQLAVLDATSDTEERPVSLAAAFGRLKRIRTFYFFLLGLGALGFALFSVPLFLNLFLEEAFQLDTFERGVVVSLTYAGGLAGAPLGGVLGDRLFRRSPPRAVLLIGAAIAGYGIFFTAGLFMPNTVLLTIVIGIGVGLSQLGFVTASAVNAAVIPYRMRAQGYAMVGLYLFVVGSFFGSVITGGMSSAFGERTALAIVVPVSSLVGGALIAYGARYVRGDLSLVVEELLEEQESANGCSAAARCRCCRSATSTSPTAGAGALRRDRRRPRRARSSRCSARTVPGSRPAASHQRALRCPTAGSSASRAGRHVHLRRRTACALGIVQVPGGKAVFPDLTRAREPAGGAYTFVLGSRRARCAVSREVLDLFPRLAERLDQPAGTLSGGEQQMLAIAQGAAARPAGAAHRRAVARPRARRGPGAPRCRSSASRPTGITIVIVEQSVNVALSVADRAVFMEKGQVRFEGPARDLLGRDDLVRAVFLGVEGG